MKKIVYLFLLSIIVASTVSAQESKQNTIYIKSAKFVSPLLEKWIQEYKKVSPETNIQLASKQTQATDIDLSLVLTDSKDRTQKISYIGRYAVLPITTANNPLLNELNDKRLNKKRLSELFFEKDLLDEDSSKSKEKYTATVYSGNNEASIAPIFASHFGYDNSSLKGKRISGDDLFLINAIQKDNTGISFNNLSYIYDTKTRQLKSGLSLLPLDVKKDQREVFSTIDEVIALLENTSVDLIPVESLGFAYTQNDPAVQAFLKWVLSEGQTFNNEYGFLKLPEGTLAQQQKLIDKDVYLTSTQIK